MTSERRRDRLLVHAGPGEWYNQPHERRWDMGEDAADLPPAAWHVRLRRGLELEPAVPHELVVDVTEMAWLVGQDWGFLLRLVQDLDPQGCRLVVVATPHVAKAVGLLGIEDRLTVVSSLDG